MTKPVRRFCSTQARLGMAIQTGRPLTAKRISVASAWRVAMATTVPFQVQCSSSPVQRSVTLKSSYMALSRVVQGEGLGKAASDDGPDAFGYLCFKQVVFVVFVIIFIIFEFRDFEDCTGFGQVETFGGGLEGADDLGGVGPGVGPGGVHAGELEAVEEGGGAFGVEVSGGKGVDDDGEGDLDRFAVFEGGELDVLARDEVS